MTAELSHTLFLLAFDHRGSFQKDLFGVQGEPNGEQTAAIVDIKHLIFEAMVEAVGRGLDGRHAGVLVDEQYGGDVPEHAKAAGLVLAMPVERSGLEIFDFEYGPDFGAHIERLDPDYNKVLVRYNVDGDRGGNEVQCSRLKELSDWLAAHDRKFLFELLVPATSEQLESVDGDTARYDLELRPELMRRAIAELQGNGIEPQIWKIEGLDRREDNEMIAAQARSGGRDHVECIVLGRDAADDQLDAWLRAAAGLESFMGFAIGRSIWLDLLKQFVAGDIQRAAAVTGIADRYLAFIDVYREAQ